MFLHFSSLEVNGLKETIMNKLIKFNLYQTYNAYNIVMIAFQIMDFIF